MAKHWYQVKQSKKMRAMVTIIKQIWKPLQVNYILFNLLMKIKFLIHWKMELLALLTWTKIKDLKQMKQLGSIATVITALTTFTATLALEKTISIFLALVIITVFLALITTAINFWIRMENYLMINQLIILDLTIFLEIPIIILTFSIAIITILPLLAFLLQPLTKINKIHLIFQNTNTLIIIRMEYFLHF